MSNNVPDFPNDYQPVKTGIVSGLILSAGILSKDKKDNMMSKIKDPAIQAVSSMAVSYTSKYVPSVNKGADIILNSLLTGALFTIAHHFLEGKKGIFAPFVVSSTVELAARGIAPYF